MKEKVINVIASAAVASLLSYMGVLLVPVCMLLIVMVIDYITGMTKARVKDEMSSKIGIIGIVKKVGYLAIVAVAMVADWVIRSGLASVGITWNVDFFVALVVIIWLIINECISIIENVAAIGTPVPGFINKIFGKLKQVTEDKGGNGNEETEDKNNA